MILLSLFTAATVVVAVWQEDFNWGWWWAVPVGGGFLLLIIGFRCSSSAPRRWRVADREADEAEFGTTD